MVVEIGKLLVFLGVGLLIVGGVLWLSGGTLRNLPIGRLPGDILIQRDNFSFYFPMTIGILLSLVLSAMLWLARLVMR
ncbi:MAG: DUF2905 domain-containing protein [Cyanobacteria bacterium P01_D01_bin.44]